MGSEEIIERLLEEKHITVKEAMVLLKELARESVIRMFYPSNDKIFRPDFYTYDNIWLNASVNAESNSISDSCIAYNNKAL